MRTYLLRYLFIFGCFFLSTTVRAQDSATVQWKGTIQTDAAGQSHLIVSGVIPTGWHLYAAVDSADALEGLRLRVNDSIIDSRGRKWATGFQAIEDPVFEGRAKQVAHDSVRFEQVLPKERMAEFYLVTLEYEIGKADQFIPEKATLKINTGKSNAAVTSYRIHIPSIDIQHPQTNCGIESASVGAQQSKSLWGLFLLGFVAGLVALLTPCVFPMIPLTVSFFTKKAESRSTGVRNALLYGFFIFLIYVLLSLPFHFLDQLDPEILNSISTNAWLNLAFFIIFVIFAFSFFGFYDISLPASLSGTADRKAGVGKIIGIFFMALTLAIVSFSCTGPILGSLLAGSLSADGGAMQLTAGMAGFGFALALPFALFALFPHWLQSLPKSGGWLHTVKVVLGFAELALALKFFSNADLVSHWGILKREIFIGLWVLIAAGLALYLLGFLRFKHEAPLKKLHP
ncbi:MAG TPA: cytochrome c biogenesis protein CcdA, partial [Ferruginibacter sp.]|nr:cytochrome c biogenesis protein CcdA [Ferruginibacter sp.]